MYKDKPHFPPGRRKKSMDPRMAGLVLIVLSVLFLKFFVLRDVSSTPKVGSSGTSNTWVSAAEQQTWSARRDAVRDAFVTSWEGYEKYAWGMDEYNPVSKKGKNLARDAGGIGWMVVDALDTAVLMNLTTQVKHAREWMKTSLTFATNVDVNTFETTIRVLGGLLSSHYLSTTFPHLAPQADDDLHQPGEDLYLELATDLAERLLGAYETDSGIPAPSVNLNTSAPRTFQVDGGASSTAEAATLQLELKYLSQLTGEPLYWQRAERIMQVIEANHRQDGLVPIHIYPTTGQFRGQNIRLGSRGDSYYEYLIKQYLQTGSEETVYLSMWNEALEGIKKHLLVYSKYADLTVIGERPTGLSKPLSAKMDHLVCFLPGTIALSVTGGHTLSQTRAALGSGWSKEQEENMRLAEELAKTCWATYKATKTGLAPEIAYFTIDDAPRMWADHPELRSSPVDLTLLQTEDAAWRADVQIHEQDLHNLQRPETVESLLYLFQITGNPIYREWGWEMFESFMQHSKVEDKDGTVYAYTSLSNVNQVPTGKRKRDNMEGFWMAETLKYFWLLFGGNEAETSTASGPNDGLLGLSKTVLNTEAHILPRFDMGRVWKTGWARTNPALNGGSGSGDKPVVTTQQPTAILEEQRDAQDSVSKSWSDRQEPNEAKLEHPVTPPGDQSPSHAQAKAQANPNPSPPPSPYTHPNNDADRPPSPYTPLHPDADDDAPNPPASRLVKPAAHAAQHPDPIPDPDPPAAAAANAKLIGVDYSGARTTADARGRRYGETEVDDRMKAKEERFRSHFGRRAPEAGADGEEEERN